MKPVTEKLFQDPEYVQGQIASLQALILGLAQLSTSAEFREQSLDRLESLRNALLSQPVSDARLLAVDHCEAWVRTVTG